MWFFKKKNGTKQILANKDQLLNNAKLAEALMNYANLDQAVVDTIGELNEKLKYLNPSAKPEVSSLDKKIENKLLDLKIEITSNKINETKFNMIVKEITNLIADRDYQSKKN